MDTKQKSRHPDGAPRQRKAPRDRSAGTGKSKHQPKRSPMDPRREQQEMYGRHKSERQPKRRPPEARRVSTPDSGQHPVHPERKRSPSRPRPETKVDAPEMVFQMKSDFSSHQNTAPVPNSAVNGKLTLRERTVRHNRQQIKKSRSKAPRVVYTPPRPFSVNRLILHMAVVLAVVLAVTLGLSVFFKVDENKITVFGNNAYSAWSVREASGIENGDNLLTFGRIRAAGKIKAALPYINSVRIGIKLPDTVNIYIKEFDVVYAIKSQNGTWWLMTSDGKVVEQADAAIASGYTKILGVSLDNPIAGEQAAAYQEAVESTQGGAETTEASSPALDLTEATAPVVVTAADRLEAVKIILSALEQNDIVGAAASVDVTYINDIELWYGNRYQVKLGDVSQMEYKIGCMKQAIAQMHDYQMGILDVSFTVKDREKDVVYTPFE